MYIIHSKPQCPWCEKAKALLARLGYEYTEILYQTPEQIEKFKAKGFRTFPQVYETTENVQIAPFEIGVDGFVGKHIGGYEALEEYCDPDDF